MSHFENASKHAKRWFRILKGKFEFDDIYSAACYGLTRAALHFDPTKGASFQTYAFQKMDGCIQHFTRQQRRQIGWSYAPDSKDTGPVVSGMVRRAFIGQMPVDNDGNEVELPSPNQSDLIESLDLEQKRQIVRGAATDERSATIIECLLDGESVTDIARRLGISRQRVHQILPAVKARMVKAAQRAGAR